jgi:formate-dependent nitrite reductase cytochrome c552 subunit
MMIVLMLLNVQERNKARMHFDANTDQLKFARNNHSQFGTCSPLSASFLSSYSPSSVSHHGDKERFHDGENGGAVKVVDANSADTGQV